MKNLQKIASIFESSGFPFQIGGSTALFIRGLITREPEDLDIFVRGLHFDRIIDCLESVGFKELLDEGSNQDSHRMKFEGTKMCIFDGYKSNGEESIDGIPLRNLELTLRAKADYAIKYFFQSKKSVIRSAKKTNLNKALKHALDLAEIFEKSDSSSTGIL